MAGRRPAKKILCAFLLVVLFYVILLANHRKFGTLIERVVDITWKDNEMTFEEEPPLTYNLVIQYKDVDVKEYFVQIKERNIYCLESVMVPSARTLSHVLLLHDSVLSAAKWKKYGTLQLLATWGYRALAVDLPGYGRSSKEAVLQNEKLSFFSELVSKLGLHNIVLVSPSIGGLFADAFVSYNQSQFAGIITISSVLPSQAKPGDNISRKVPMLIIYGDKDQATDEVASYLSRKSKYIWVKKLQNTGIKILDERTSDFHKILYNFLQYLKRHSSLSTS